MSAPINITINNSYNPDAYSLTPESEARHRAKAAEIAARVTAHRSVGSDRLRASDEDNGFVPVAGKTPAEKIVSKVTHRLLDKQNAFIFSAAGLSKKVLKKMLLEILPGVALKIVKIAPAVLAIAL